MTKAEWLRFEIALQNLMVRYKIHSIESTTGGDATRIGLFDKGGRRMASFEGIDRVNGATNASYRDM